MTLQSRLREKSRLARQRRLIREAYQPVAEQVRSVVPVVFPYTGRMQSWRIHGDPQRVLQTLQPDCVFALDTAVSLRWGQRLLSRNDIFAYCTNPEAAADLERDCILEDASGVSVSPPLWDRPPHLFLSVVRDLPDSDVLTCGARVVKPERLLAEFIGLLGLRYDLLAVVCTCWRAELESSS